MNPSTKQKQRKQGDGKTAANPEINKASAPSHSYAMLQNPVLESTAAICSKIPQAL